MDSWRLYYQSGKYSWWLVEADERHRLVTSPSRLIVFHHWYYTPYLSFYFCIFLGILHLLSPPFQSLSTSQQSLPRQCRLVLNSWFSFLSLPKSGKTGHATTPGFLFYFLPQMVFSSSFTPGSIKIIESNLNEYGSSVMPNLSDMVK